jgi:hypothetical protein
MKANLSRRFATDCFASVLKRRAKLNRRFAALPSLSEK